MPDTYFEFVLGYLSLWLLLMGGLTCLWMRLRKVEKKLEGRGQ